MNDDVEESEIEDEVDVRKIFIYEYWNIFVQLTNVLKWKRQQKK